MELFLTELNKDVWVDWLIDADDFSKKLFWEGKGDFIIGEIADSGKVNTKFMVSLEYRRKAINERLNAKSLLSLGYKKVTNKRLFREATINRLMRLLK